LVLGWKEFNGTPHFCFLPQGERRIRRMLPHPDPLPQGGERRKMKRTLTLTFSRMVIRGDFKGREGMKGKIV
jgi:hypothetical protein